MKNENFIFFSSRDLFHKSVFGAVEAQRPFNVRILLKRDDYFKGAVIIFDKDKECEMRFELLDDGKTDQNGFYTRSAEVCLPEGLYFYKFIIYTSDGEKVFLNTGGGIGGFNENVGTPWQLTVYERGFETPDSFKGGIIYQIFPDRFLKGENTETIPPDRNLRPDWGGLPFYKDDGEEPIGKDFFGGNLNGITTKLDYLKDLGVSIIYLNPIFESQSNHRYDTSNYMKIDPILGSEYDFENLCKKAKEKGIAIILDGVFSHTGDDSIYFNSKGRYNTLGAFQSTASPYYHWYKFKNHPNDYLCWWGIKTLPEVDETENSFLEFITGENGVISYWMKKGASGFRLDVADELPDLFLDKVRQQMKKLNPEGYLVGEVWEDATNKISYNHRRRFLRGKQLDSVMNYPFGNALIAFVKGESGFTFAETVMQICENYPKPALDTLMNHIGTHDTARAITLLSNKDLQCSREKQAHSTLSFQEYSLGAKRLKCAAVLQYTLPGIPSIFYGDEAGLTGGKDPFCRGCFPWGNEDRQLTEFYKKLGNARKKCPAFKDGIMTFLSVGEEHVLYQRETENSIAVVGVNLSPREIFINTKTDYSFLLPIFGDVAFTEGIKIKPGEFVLLIG